MREDYARLCAWCMLWTLEVICIEANFDWDAVRTTYVTTLLTLAQLAKQYGLKKHTVEERCRREGWVAARAEFRLRATCRAVDAAVDVEADRLAGLIRAAESMVKVIEGVYLDKQQFHRHLVTDTTIDEYGCKSSVTVEKQFDKVDTKALKELSGAIKDMTYAVRNLNNLPTQAEAEAQRIAAERLEMDKRKMEQENTVDKEIKVVFAGDMERFAK